MKKGRIARDKCTHAYTSSIPADWLVEVIGTELPTPHAVIEPVSTFPGTEFFDAETGLRGPERYVASTTYSFTEEGRIMFILAEKIGPPTGSRNNDDQHLRSSSESDDDRWLQHMIQSCWVRP